MAWWSWAIAGLVLLCTELFIPVDFYFIFIGIALLLTAFFTYVGLLPAAWLQWTVAAALGALLVFVVRKRLFASLHASSATVPSGIEGQKVKVVADIAPGATGRAEARGSFWSVQNNTKEPLRAGESYIVNRRDGLILIVDAI